MAIRLSQLGNGKCIVDKTVLQFSMANAMED